MYAKHPSTGNNPVSVQYLITADSSSRHAGEMGLGQLLTGLHVGWLGISRGPTTARAFPEYTDSRTSFLYEKYLTEAYHDVM